MTGPRGSAPRAFYVAGALAICLGASARVTLAASPLVSTGVQLEFIELPFTFSGLRRGTVHPGFFLGAEWAFWDGTNWSIAGGAQAGYYHHALLRNGAYLLPTASAEYYPVPSLTTRWELGAGALHTWSATDSFRQQSDGSYASATDWGQTRFMPATGIGTGWRLEPQFQTPLEIVLRYTLFLEMPFSTPEEIGAVPHSLIQLGIRFPWSTVRP